MAKYSTAKEYLDDMRFEIKYLFIQSNDARENAEKWRETAINPRSSSFSHDKVQQSRNSDRMADNITKAAFYSEKFDELLNEWARLKTQVKSYLTNNLPNDKTREMMILYYVKGLEHPQIEDKLGISRRWVRKLHQNALILLEKNFEKN